MSYEPLHHKYRPQTFAELVGQEAIALTLTNAIASEKIAPAYLFTGPRGTGKTSSARILAKSLNCLQSNKPTPYPCGKCESCRAIATGSALDVMEIDAASNTGVDNIREIIERSRFAPVQCRYKVYVIDECHMLSTAAFNALLKTLEEPPPQVVFVLATTDPQRVLSTIISRCQRFDYRRIPLETMVEHLEYIAKQEQIAINDEALTLIAQIANGGLRDAESLLDQLSLLPETITVEKVWDLVGAVPERDLLALLNAIKCDRYALVLQQCRSLLDRGREPLVVLQNLASFYLNLLIAKTAPQSSDLVAVTETCWQQLCTEANNWEVNEILRGQQHLKEAETQIKQTTQPRLWLEVTLLGLLSQGRIQETAVRKQELENSSQEIGVRKQELENSSQEIGVRKQGTERERPLATNHQQISTSSNESATVNPQPAATINNELSTINHQPYEAIWQKVLDRLQPPTTKALLSQQCHLVGFNGSSAIVGISSAKLQKLHQGKVVNIETAFEQVCQRKIKVSLEVASKTPQQFPGDRSLVSQTESDDNTVSPFLSVSQTENTIIQPLTIESLPEPSTLVEEQPINQTPAEVIPVIPVDRQVTHSDRPKTAPPSVDIPIVAYRPSAIAQSPEQDTVSHFPKPTEPIANINQQEEIDNSKQQLQIENEIEDDDNSNILQQAIADMAQSFAGELVELYPINLSPSTTVVPEKSQLSTPAIKLPDSHTVLNNRPDLSEYDDDEDIPF